MAQLTYREAVAAGMAQEHLAIWRNADAATFTRDERPAANRLQFPDCPGHRGLCQRKAFGGAADAAVARDLHECLKMA